MKLILQKLNNLKKTEHLQQQHQVEALQQQHQMEALQQREQTPKDLPSTQCNS